MNSRNLFTELVLKITLSEQADEINQLVFLVMGHVFGLSPAEILSSRKIEWTPDIQNRIKAFIDRINQHEPIQYILGKAYFYGRTFLVNPDVLIPRPETEELIYQCIHEGNVAGKNVKILDIGTGSGCIAITLKLKIPSAQVFATDISREALAVAHQNADQLAAPVTFLHHDILNNDLPLHDLDMIVSNPPYIAQHEKSTLAQNVVNHEPHLALFAESDDPLIFYKAIAEKAKNALRPGGMVMVEINERFGEATAEIFSTHAYHPVLIIQDIQGKDRIISATYTPS
jgi:release factor glutamine methyltransferase